MSLILGNNLGVHSLLGFVERFTANHPCRACKIHKNSIQQNSSLDTKLLCNKENYEIDLVLNDISRTGISQRYIFIYLLCFHAVENLSFDLMHDIYPGSWILQTHL